MKKKKIFLGMIVSLVMICFGTESTAKKYVGQEDCGCKKITQQICDTCETHKPKLRIHRHRKQKTMKLASRHKAKIIKTRIKLKPAPPITEGCNICNSLSETTTKQPVIIDEENVGRRRRMQTIPTFKKVPE